MVTNKTLVNAKSLENIQTTQITSTAITILDKITITNVTSSNVTFSANICDFGETPTNTNLIIQNKIVAPGETYDCFELVGQVIENGSFLSMIAGTASALTIKIDGRIIT